jgi:hypothetical protein
LKWEKNLEEYIVAIAPYGGPVESMGEVPLCVVRKQHNRLSAGSVLFGSWLCKGSYRAKLYKARNCERVSGSESEDVQEW